MPINRNLNANPYFDDFSIDKQFHRVLFKPSYAVQARELTQLQSILQNQIEQFGDNIFKEGSIIKGSNFTEVNDLKYVKVKDRPAVGNTPAFDPTEYIGGIDGEEEIFYELEGRITNLRAAVISASRGFETNSPNLNTFYIRYLNTNESQTKVFQAGEIIDIKRIRVIGDTVQTPQPGDDPVDSIAVTQLSNHVGSSFGLRISDGVIFQKGHFLFAEDQFVIASKYTDQPDEVSIGYVIDEQIITALQDDTLYDNASGYKNENAPGADRLKLVPVLTVKTSAQADSDTEFFTLIKYLDGNAVQIRDVSQYNAISEEMARRTYEESGDYISSSFNVRAVRREGNIQLSISPGVAYVKGYRVETRGEFYIDIDPLDEASIASQTNQPVSFNYGNYFDIDTLSGTVPLGNYDTVDLKNSLGTDIGTARVKNITPTRLYVFDIKMDNTATNFSDVASVVDPGNGTITLRKSVTTSGNTAILRSTNNAEMVFDTGMFSLYNTSDILLPIRVRQDLIGSIDDSNTAQIVIASGTGADFDIDNSDIVVVDDSNTLLTIDSLDVSVNKQILTINLTPGQSPSSDGTIYYNKRIQDADPYVLTAKTIFVKSSFTSSTTQYNLGFPNVYKIVSITDINGTDVKESFRLKTNQKDHYYDHSYIEYINGRLLPADGLMTIEMKVLEITDDNGLYFFTAESYQIDTNEENDSYFTTNEIPVFTSSSGTSYNLRDSFDFRPYVDLVSGADYNDTTVGAAATIPAAINLTPSFTGDFITPALNVSATVNYEYYLNRTDVVTVDSYGKFSLIKGEESEKSVAPPANGRLPIAEIYIPGDPILSPEEANAQKRPRYSVKVKARGTKKYTMKDIESIDQKIEQIRYYVLLSALESATQNLNILDENGLSRFKNGIIVDSFEDLSIANLDDTQYSAALDFTERSLTPAVKTFPLALKYGTSTNASIWPDLNSPEVGTILKNDDVAILSQPYATNSRSCVSNFYSYKGNGQLSPEYDFSYDTVTNPVQMEIDFFTPLQQFADNLQEFIPLTSVSSDVIAESNVRNVEETSGNRVNTIRLSDLTVQDTTRALQITSNNSEQAVGDFVTNFTFTPFMRSREIKIYVAGLRPNTRHYFFFDQIDVNASVSPGTSDVDFARDVQISGIANAPVITDSNGVLRAVFTIPGETFFVGDRRLEITDVNVYGDIDSSSTSYAFLMYRAYNFSIEKSSLTLSTRMPETTVVESSSNRNVANREFVSSRRRKDPLAQTFFIKSGMGLGSDTIFASKIDLFFKRKSDINGVTIMLREVVNGYPSYDIIPFSKVHLTPGQVSTSDDALTATTIIFPAPIRLDVEKEYAVVIEPDAADPDYLVFISKVGGTNLEDGSAVIQDWGDGMLFTSTNNSAWESHQDEDIKFKLYRTNFSVSSASITLTNDDHEFLSIENSIGKFISGEFAYSEKAYIGSTANTVSITEGSNIISGTDMSDTYAIGDYILVDDGDDKNYFRVVDANTTAVVGDRPALFTAVDASGYPIVGGNIVYYNYRSPDLIVIESSSAATGKIFEVGDTVYGFESGAYASIQSIDNVNISYFQPMILRTNDSVTRTTLTGTFVDPQDLLVPYTKSLKFNDKATFGGKGAVIYSKSNNLINPKIFNLTVGMTNAANQTSTPFVDIETAMIMAYQYKSTNSSATTSKYISKTVELAEDLDAEDFQIYVTAYRPNGTDVKVWIKAKSSTDPLSFDDNEWIELELTNGLQLYSSSSNLNDFKEYVYKISSTNKNVDGVFSYSNSAGTFDGYKNFAIRIDLISENIFDVPRLRDYRGISLT